MMLKKFKPALTTLNADTLFEIMQFLKPADWATLAKTNSFFRKFILENKRLWQSYIAQRFPYLQKNMPEEFHNNPFLLFKQYHIYEKLLTNIYNQFDESTQQKIAQLLPQAVAGDVESIEKSDLPSAAKQKLLQVAVLSGYVQILPLLKPNSLIEAYLAAACSGNIQVMSLINAADFSDNFDILAPFHAMTNAIQSENKQIFITVLNHLQNTSNLDKSHILVSAAAHGYKWHLIFLREQYRDELHPSGYLRAFFSALDNERFDNAEYLAAFLGTLNQFERFTFNDQIFKLKNWDKHYSRKMNLLLKALSVSPDCRETISYDNILKIFLNATEAHAISTLKILLTQFTFYPITEAAYSKSVRLAVSQDSVELLKFLLSIETQQSLLRSFERDDLLATLFIRSVFDRKYHVARHLMFTYGQYFPADVVEIIFKRALINAHGVNLFDLKERQVNDDAVFYKEIVAFYKNKISQSTMESCKKQLQLGKTNNEYLNQILLEGTLTQVDDNKKENNNNNTATTFTQYFDRKRKHQGTQSHAAKRRKNNKKSILGFRLLPSTKRRS